ncbi:MAG: S9 family peptidase [Anaerolineae bacterium]|nr:S9 family peptidase [Anaerolineae bacterium]
MSNDKRPITIDDLYKLVAIEDPSISPDGRYIAYVQVTIDKIEDAYQRNLWLAPTDGEKPVRLTYSGKDSQPRWSPDGRVLAFTSGRGEKPQIYLLPIDGPGGEARALTAMPNGAGRAAWSPDGTQIAFLSKVNAEERAGEDRGEEDPPPADKFEATQQVERKEHEEAERWDPRPVWRIPYRQGTSFLDDRFDQIYVMPAAAGLSKEEARPRRLTGIDAHHDEPRWTPDGQYILTARASEPESDEPSRSRCLYRIRLADGAEERLTDDEYAGGNPLPSPDGRWIAYNRIPHQNMYTHITRLALIPSDGGAPRDLTLALDRSLAMTANRPWSGFRWTADSRAIIFLAGDQGNTEVYQADVATGVVEKVIPGCMQVEDVDISAGGGIAFSAGTPENPSELFWQPVDADSPQQLTEANTALLDEVIVQPTQEMRFQSHDGTEIQGWYILPPGYEEGQSYPLAFNIHGGPHVMWGPGSRTMWHEWQLHAARGYVVFYCNPRGGEGYGEAFRRALYRGWGEADFPDLMAGIDALLSKGFVDPDRMAVTGGSYGGFMTAWVAGHTDRFACAFAQRGVYNLTSFYGTSDIPTLISDEFDVEPWEEPELLWKYSPAAYAHHIKTPLVILASENDFRVPIEQSEQLFAMVRRSGGTVEFLRYPRDGHELSRSGEPAHRASRLQQMLDWFDKYCVPKQT